MLPEAKKDDLLYVTDSTKNDVDVYSYPNAKLVGTLVGFHGPQGECVDAKGDIFVVDQNSSVAVFEYSHGGTKPVRELNDRKYEPFGCSVDPYSGNLSLTSEFKKGSYDYGDLAVYVRAKGKPKHYPGGANRWFYSCTYDDKGNVFIDGYAGDSTNSTLFELPKNDHGFTEITLNQVIHDPGRIIWDGRYLTVGERGDHGAPHGHSWIYSFRVTGKRGTEVGVTSLRRDTYAEQYWIQGSQVLAGENNVPDDVYAWNYPDGGLPKSRIGGVTRPVGVTVSVAQSR